MKVRRETVRTATGSFPKSIKRVSDRYDSIVRKILKTFFVERPCVEVGEIHVGEAKFAGSSDGATIIDRNYKKIE
jgi:hypothetical protein